MKFQMLIRFMLLFFCLSMMIASAKADDIKTEIKWYQKNYLDLIDLQMSRTSD